MQEQTPSSKWWKRLASLTTMALPTVLELNFVKVSQSLQTCRFFLIRRGVPGAVLMSLNAIASFSLLWHNWNTFPSSTSSRTNFIQGMYPGSYISPDNLCSSEDGLNLTVHFNPGATQLFLHTYSALSQPFNTLTEMPVASTSLDVWLQHIAPSSILRLHFKKCFGRTFPISTLPWILQATAI